MMRYPVLAFLLACGGSARGDGFDAFSEARGRTWLRAHPDPWLTLSCPALLPAAEGISLGACHSPGLFGLRELSNSAFTSAIGWGSGGAGVALSHFGYARYRQIEITAGSGIRAGSVNFGTGIRLRHLSVHGYGSAVVAGLDAALVVRHGPAFVWGMKIANLNRPPVGSSGERLGPGFSCECMFIPADGLEVTLHAGNEYGRPVSLRAGLACSLSGEVAFMCGVSGEFSRLHAGLSVVLPGFLCGYTVTTHSVLGWTHYFSVGVRFAG